MKPGTYIILTAEVWSLAVSPAERVLLAYISGLCRNGGRCYQSNAGLAEVMGCDPRTIRRQLSNLIAGGHLVAIKSAEGRQLRSQVSTPPDKNVRSGGTGVSRIEDKSVHHIIENNISTNKAMKRKPTQREAVAYMCWLIETDPECQKVPREAVPTIAKDCLDYYEARDNATKSGKIRNWTPVLTRWLINSAQRIPQRQKAQPRDAAADLRWYEKRANYWRKRIDEADRNDPRLEDWERERKECIQILGAGLCSDRG